MMIIASMRERERMCINIFFIRLELIDVSFRIYFMMMMKDVDRHPQKSNSRLITLNGNWERFCRRLK